MAAHIHFHHMVRYTLDEQQCKHPWTLWQWMDPGLGVWQNCGGTPHWKHDFLYARKEINREAITRLKELTREPSTVKALSVVEKVIREQDNIRETAEAIGIDYCEVTPVLRSAAEMRDLLGASSVRETTSLTREMLGAVTYQAAGKSWNLSLVRDQLGAVARIRAYTGTSDMEKAEQWVRTRHDVPPSLLKMVARLRKQAGLKDDQSLTDLTKYLSWIMDELDITDISKGLRAIGEYDAEPYLKVLKSLGMEDDDGDGTEVEARIDYLVGLEQRIKQLIADNDE